MRVAQIIISAVTAFIVIGGGCFAAVLVALEGKSFSRNAMWVSVVTGLVAAAKDVRATLALPPLNNGNYEALKRFMEMDNKKKERNETDKETGTGN